MAAAVTFRSEYFFSTEHALADAVGAAGTGPKGGTRGTGGTRGMGDTAETLDFEPPTPGDDTDAPGDDVSMPSTWVVLDFPSAKQLGPFEIGRVLGRGCSSTVHLGTHNTTGLQVALKIIKKEYFSTNSTLWAKV